MTVLMSSEKWKKKKKGRNYIYLSKYDSFVHLMHLTLCLPPPTDFPSVPEIQVAWGSPGVSVTACLLGYELSHAKYMSCTGETTMLCCLWGVCQLFWLLEIVPRVVPWLAASAQSGKVCGGKRPLCHTTAWQEIYKMTTEEEDEEEEKKSIIFFKHWGCQAWIYSF